MSNIRFLRKDINLKFYYMENAMDINDSYHETELGQGFKRDR